MDINTKTIYPTTMQTHANEELWVDAGSGKTFKEFCMIAVLSDTRAFVNEFGFTAESEKVYKSCPLTLTIKEDGTVEVETPLTLTLMSEVDKALGNGILKLLVLSILKSSPNH